MNTGESLALYIHLPWCVRKCPYCDFNSHPMPVMLDQASYIDALLTDLDYELEYLKIGPRIVRTIFIGGGTPSLFSAMEVDRLLGGIRSRLVCGDDLEVTLEANPGTLEHDKFSGYRQAGVNRLSIGVQSFHPDSLRRLGRIHGPDEARQAIGLAREAGFDNLNLDLMCGLPAQDMAMVQDDVLAVVAEAPAHVSYYQLTLEPNTPFHQRPPDALPDHDQEFEMLRAGRQLLEQAGYRQYEVSAFARPGMQCRHNLNYWQFGDYIGIGAGAHGKIQDPSNGRVIRRWRVKGPGRYQALAGTEGAISGERCLNSSDRVIEFMMNALRLRSGFTPELFMRRTGQGEELLWARLERPIAQGLVRVVQDRVRLTQRGWRFLDDVLAGFL